MDQLSKYLIPYKDRFKEKDFETLPEYRLWDAQINLVPDTPKEIHTRVYPITKEELKELDKFIKEGLSTEKI